MFAAGAPGLGLTGLQDDMFLSDYSIGEGHTIMVVQRLPGAPAMVVLPREEELWVRETIPLGGWDGLLESVLEGELENVLAWVQGWGQGEVREGRRSLAAILQAISHRALYGGSVGVGAMMVAQFAEMEDFADSLATAIAWLLRHHALNHWLPSLLNKFCCHPALAPHALSTTLLVVNTMVEWVTPSQDLARDRGMVEATRKLVSRMPILATRQPATLVLVYEQVSLTMVHWPTCSR